MPAGQVLSTIDRRPSLVYYTWPRHQRNFTVCNFEQSFRK